MQSEKRYYLALLRGINVGGKHKVPMEALRQAMEKMGFNQIKTLLNSGNVVFEGLKQEIAPLEEEISSELAKTFGFSIPVLLRTYEEIDHLVAADPFKNIIITSDIRLYVTFLRNIAGNSPSLPWSSPDGSHQILDAAIPRTICSVLNLSINKTPDAMAVLDKFYGKDITTRNWNTVIKSHALFPGKGER